MVFEITFSYLKGFHLTLSQHLPQRDEENWKISDLQRISHIEQRVDDGKITREEADLISNRYTSCIDHPSPKQVDPVSIFVTYLDMLLLFMSS